MRRPARPPRETDTGTKLSRRHFLGAAAVAAAAAAARLPLVVSVQAQTPDPQDQGLLLVNGNIHTMDARNTVASIVAVRNGRIVSVGNSRPPQQPNTRVIDLAGRTVVPGLIETHVHMVSLTLRPGYHTVLENTISIREIQEALAARRKSVPESQWITSMGGWHPNQWAERRRPTLRELDDAVRDRPVLLYERFSGPCVTNSLGKAFFDAADAAPPVHPDAARVNVAADGLIAENAPSTNALFHLRHLQTFDDKKRSTIDAMNYSAGIGLLTHLDQVGLPKNGPLHPSHNLANFDPFRMYDPWLAVYREGKAPIRLQANFQMENQTDPQGWELQERLRNNFPMFGDDMFRNGAIYANGGAPRDSAAWFEKQRLIARAGWRHEQHGGDLKNLTLLIEGYEKLTSEVDITRLRWNLHEIAPDAFKPDLIARLKALNCGVIVNAREWVVSSDGKDLNVQFRSILHSGIRAAICGDGAHIAPLNPWTHMHFATTGLNSFGQQVNPNERITRQEALQLFTRGSSWFLGMDDRVGAIEPGKLADLVVLNKDYFTVPDAEIRQIRSVLSVVDGRIVHNAGIA